MPALTTLSHKAFYMNEKVERLKEGRAIRTLATGLGCRFGRLFQQFMLGYITNQLGVVLHPHFLQNARTVGADGFCA